MQDVRLNILFTSIAIIGCAPFGIYLLARDGAGPEVALNAVVFAVGLLVFNAIVQLVCWKYKLGIYKNRR